MTRVMTRVMTLAIDAAMGQFGRTVGLASDKQWVRSVMAKNYRLRTVWWPYFSPFLLVSLNISMQKIDFH